MPQCDMALRKTAAPVSQANRSPSQSVELMKLQAAIDFEKALPCVVHSSAVQAIPIDGQSEAELIQAAERQIKLIGRLFRKLQHLTQPSPRSRDGWVRKQWRDHRPQVIRDELVDHNLSLQAAILSPNS